MPSIRLSGVDFSYPGGDALLRDITAHLEPGWYGLVGANGSGKTTLLRLLSDQLAPTAGSVARQPQPCLISLCEQELTAPSAAVRALAEAWDRASLRIQARLGLEIAQLERWPRLSPGERKRWQLGAALSARPDVLLLDEPSNHIDAHCRALVVGALQRFRGVGVVVSHDRALLDALTTTTLRLQSGQLEQTPLPYSRARSLWLHDQRRLREQHQALRAQERATRRALADARRRRSAAGSRLSASARMKGPRDSDARGVAAQGRVARAEARLSRGVAVDRKRFERASAARQALRVDRERGGSVFVDYRPPRRSRLLDLSIAELRAGGTLLARDLVVQLDRNSRLSISGPNGSGKTTLVRAIRAGLALPDERVLYLPQELDAGADRRLLAAVAAMDSESRTRTLQIADALALDPETLRPGQRLSPGETRKLAIARGLGAHVWLAILDEPTNHLDLPSVERLQAALADYPGALVLVSHDDQLVEQVAGPGRQSIHLGEGSPRSR